MQYRTEKPYSRVAMGPMLAAGPVRAVDLQAEVPAAGAQRVAYRAEQPERVTASCTTSNVVITSNESGSPAAASRTW